MLDDFFEQLDKPVARDTHPAALDKDSLLKVCQITKGRASGPGGQHRNKVETHITIVHKPSGIDAQAGERRLVKENTRVAIRRLRLKLALEIRVHVPAGEIRSELWKSRTPKGKIVCNSKHWDYPSLLAEAFDVLEDAKYEIKKASVRLGCSGTQLIRLIAEHAPSLVTLNREREARGLRALKP